jgi:hypothetical protein
MSTDDHHGPRQLAFDPLREADGAIALRGEVALQSDNIRLEAATRFESGFFAVDAEIEDFALVTVSFETGGDADRAERLDECEHLEPEDAADRRFDESDFHRETSM